MFLLLQVLVTHLSQATCFSPALLKPGTCREAKSKSPIFFCPYANCVPSLDLNAFLFNYSYIQWLEPEYHHQSSFFLLFYLFIFGCVGSSLLRTGFLQLQQAGATLCCGTWASHCGGFSCCGVWAPGTGASVVMARGISSCGSWALERRLSSCGTWAQLLHSMWDLPQPGLEPVSPALAGGFLTIAPPGKPITRVL